MAGPRLEARNGAPLPHDRNGRHHFPTCKMRWLRLQPEKRGAGRKSVPPLTSGSSVTLRCPAPRQTSVLPSKACKPGPGAQADGTTLVEQPSGGLEHSSSPKLRRRSSPHGLVAFSPPRPSSTAAAVAPCRARAASV
jgi:hypothetical protein